MHPTRLYSRYIHPPTKYMSTIVVIGGSGALGKAFISHFKSQNYVNKINFIHVFTCLLPVEYCER